ncbi:DNA internalization-related competence protein ComEC/Rec2 [Saccharospirillum mangrovi]|uniref:DNA internalization-related competence protein ComEC/Rec2 n=1 Tax=Saccharospirillum mangrovi TaxID=2161747 RepID=UPI000D3AF1B4|nr:DNA internalization-related competence protein ComEC/Rec2 [Saccharospirillum mangrovi]
MINGLTGLALLCLSLPYLWFQCGLLGAALPVTVLLCVAYRRVWTALIWLIFGAVLVCRLEAEAQHLLPASWQHKQAELSLCLAQPPQVFDQYQRFSATVLAQPADLQLRHVRLTANANLDIQAGDCLRAQVRLRQPVGQLIPGNFNATRYFFSERIDAQGSVVELIDQTLNASLVVRWYQRAAPQFDDSRVRDIWAALALGWSASMDANLADLFEQNQIKHLMVVSGMHIGMVAAWALLLARLFHRLPGPWRGHWPVLRWVTVVSLCGAFVAITGFGFPAVRAWLMVLLPLGVMLSGGRLGGLQSMALAAVAIAAMRPQAWLSTGAWLSFGLVWVMIRLYQRWRSEGLPGWQMALRMQLLLSVFSLPMSALMGFQWHPLSLLINLLVIPLVTLIILPWSLLILVWPPLVHWGYQWLVSWGLDGLVWIARWHQPPPVLTFAEIALFAALFWLVLSHWLNREQRWLLVPLAGLLLLWPVRSTPPDEFRLTTLDVGHGLALVLEWPDQTWLYDTAGQWSDGTSIAQARLAPWFRRRHLAVDGIVISHSDNDHAGGAAWAIQRWPDARRISGEPDAVAELSGQGGWQSCHDSPPADLPFRLIATPKALRTSDNDRSCLLLVETKAGRLLITGDASRNLEYWLMQQYPQWFPLSLVVLGHHGSRTSSASGFLDASPEALLLVSAGDRARPRWPNPDLLDYLQQRQRNLLNTAWHGTIEVDVDASNNQWQVRDWRSSFRRRFLSH